MVKRVIVGAHYGLRDWLTQRVTAGAMALYMVVFIVIVLAARPSNYVAWRGLFLSQPMKLATLLFFVSLFAHTWVGMRDILMDYIHPTALRLGLEVVVALALIAWAGWAIQILWSIQ